MISKLYIKIISLSNTFCKKEGEKQHIDPIHLMFLKSNLPHTSANTTTPLPMRLLKWLSPR